jgi:small subunit ribosomal protein S6
VVLAMRAYELMVIFDRDADEATRKSMLGQVEKLVKPAGRVETTDDWGVRRFAYEIDHKEDGHYAVLEVVTEAPGLDDVDRTLRLADEVVRHKIIRLPDDEAGRRGLFGETASVEAG